MGHCSQLYLLFNHLAFWCSMAIQCDAHLSGLVLADQRSRPYCTLLGIKLGVKASVCLSGDKRGNKGLDSGNR